MIIKIDTAVMRQMANTSLRVESLVEEAMKLSNAITTHNDWNCQERDVINDSVSLVKKNNVRINEKVEIFANKIAASAEQFDELDRSLLTRFQQFDSSVGELFAVKGVTTIAPSSVAQEIPVKIDPELNWESYHATTLFRPISVVKFDEITKGIQNRG